MKIAATESQIKRLAVVTFMSLLRNLLRASGHSVRKAERARRMAHLPTCPSSDDTYLVEFPKSGVTWLSFLIANTNFLINKLPLRATWWNINDYVTDIRLSRTLPAHGLPLPGGRFIKSHATYHPDYYKVIYLVRDPRAVFPSFYDMALKQNWFRGSMDDFLVSKDFGIDNWVTHVEGWLNRRGFMRIYFLRYRDLHNDPLAVLKRLYDLFGLQVDEQILNIAIERSSFTNMQKEEQLYRESSFERNPAFQFVRKGLVHNFSSELTRDQILAIEAKCGPLMRKFGFEVSTDSVDVSGRQKSQIIADFAK